MGRISQGNEYGIQGISSLNYIPLNDVPKGQKVACGNFVCDHQPLKVEPWRGRVAVEGNKLPYQSDTGPPAASMLETKIIINSVISEAKRSNILKL